MYRKTVDLCILALHPATWLNSLISSYFFFVDSQRFFAYIVLSKNKQFYFCLSNLYTFYCLTALVRASSSFLFLALLHWLEPPVQCWTEEVRADSSSCSQSYGARYSALCHQEMLPVIFSYLSFIRLMKFPSMPSFLSLFYCEGRLAVATIFSAPFEMIYDFSFFSLIIWWIALIDFWILNQSGIPLINLNLLWCSGSDGKVSVYNAEDPGPIPGLGRSPGGGNGNPLQYSCLENPTDGRVW